MLPINGGIWDSQSIVAVNVYKTTLPTPQYAYWSAPLPTAWTGTISASSQLGVTEFAIGPATTTFAIGSVILSWSQTTDITPGPIFSIDYSTTPPAPTYSSLFVSFSNVYFEYSLVSSSVPRQGIYGSARTGSPQLSFEPMTGSISESFAGDVWFLSASQYSGTYTSLRINEEYVSSSYSSSYSASVTQSFTSSFYLSRYTYPIVGRTNESSSIQIFNRYQTGEAPVNTLAAANTFVTDGWFETINTTLTSGSGWRNVPWGGGVYMPNSGTVSISGSKIFSVPSGQTILSTSLYTWPSALGASGTILSQDGTGKLAWVVASGSSGGSGVSASYATTASYASVAQILLGNITSASYALTASYAANGGGTSTTTGSFTGSFTGSLLGSASYAITSSYSLNNAGAVTSAQTASVAFSVSGSGTGSFTGSFIGSLLGSASYATTASAATSITFVPNSASFATTASSATSITFTPNSASYALTASYAANGGGISTTTGSFTGTFTGDVIVPSYTTILGNTSYVWPSGSSLSNTFVSGNIVTVMYVSAAIASGTTNVTSSAANYLIGSGTTNAAGVNGAVSAAFDGNINTSWTTNAFQVQGQVFHINLNATQSIAGYIYNSTGHTETPVLYDVSGSLNNGATWFALTGSIPGASYDYQLFPSSALVTNFRFTLQSPRASNYWNIWELTVLTKATSSVPAQVYFSLLPNNSGSFTGSFIGSASYATSASIAISASWAPGTGASVSASYALTSSYASFALTSSLLAVTSSVSASWASSSLSSSYALTASYAANGGGTAGMSFFNNAIVQSHFSGTNGATTFVDAKNRVLSGTGGASLSNSNPKFGGTCLALNGTTQYVTVSQSRALNISQDFTLELYARTGVNNKQYCTLLERDNGAFAVDSWALLFNAGSIGDGKVAFYRSSLNAGAAFLTSVTAINDNAWHHVAVVGSGGVFTLFVDGKIEDMAASAASPAINTAAMLIGASVNAGRNFSGSIDEIRILKGIAAYVDTFTTGSAEFPDS